MSMRSLLLPVVVAAFFSCGKAYQVVKPSEGNPVAGNKKFAVLPLDWSGVKVDEQTEDAFLAAADADMKKEWPADKDEAAKEFERGAMEAATGGPVELAAATDPAAAPFAVKTHILDVATGGVRPTIITCSTQLTDGTGKVVEEISYTSAIQANLMAPTIGVRLNRAAEQCGTVVAGYLKDKSKGK